MSMTNEEAIKSFQNIIEYWTYKPTEVEAAKMAISALRPITREQVERVWRGEWMLPIFSGQKVANDLRCQCSECGSIETPLVRHRFCPSCGAPMTDKAVDMVMERLEAMQDEKG